MDEKITTIQVKETTKNRMDQAKVHPRETYDDLINRVLDETK